MNLWILRHGEAERQARTDAARELTPRGRKEVLRSAAHLSLPLHAIVASPYVRAQQTAALVREALGFEPQVITVPWLTPESDPLAVLDAIDDSLEGVLLVTHQPLAGTLAGFLQHGHYGLPEAMNTATLVRLEGEFVLAGSMTLRQLLHP